MLSPSHRLGREVARDLLFPKLAPAASANALSTALSLAREALVPLGHVPTYFLRADRANIWVAEEVPLDIDAEAHDKDLRSALRMEPGAERDDALSSALKQDGVLLDEERYADWAVAPRQALELLRQRARFELARDRARGFGHSHPDAVVEAWEECLASDPTSEEAASSLVRIHSVRGNQQLASSAYERCRAALEVQGLRISPELASVWQTYLAPSPRLGGTTQPATVASGTGKEERRIVSVLHAELSAPAGPQVNKDPEDLRSLVGSAVATLIAEAEGLGGTLTSVSGSGVVAVFGAPEAHEDDPERAVTSASRMVAAIVTRAGRTAMYPLSLRVAVETGPAVVGRLWSATGVGYSAVGSVVQVAAALASAANAGSVLVGPATKAATEGVFEWGPPGAEGGAAAAMDATHLQRSKPGGTHRRGLATRAPLVGREAELAALEEVLHRTTSGDGSVVFLVAEPGLGKTRLVSEARNRFMGWVGAGTGRLPLWLEGRCVSYASSTPYGLFRQLLSAWIAIGPEEPEEVVRPAFERAMRAVFAGDVDEAVFLAHMLGLRGNGASAVSRLSPEGLQWVTFASVSRLVERVAQRGPTVLVLEDLHWADPISLRLTGELVRLTEHAPLLLLATRRPDPDPGVAGLEQALESALGPRFRRWELPTLSESAERDLARWMVGEPADADVLAAVSKNTDGNPLFLEERFTSLVEMGALVRTGSTWSLGDAQANEVPDVLERLVRSRVDRLPAPAQDAIVAASVLGPEFALSALAAVTDLGERLPEAVVGLCRARLLVEVRQLPEPVYRFRHAVIQEATYGGLLRSQRTHLHARAAWGLEAAAAERPEDVAAVLGHHYAMAGERDRAVRFLQFAARDAAAHFAIDEAVYSYRKAMAVIEQGASGDRPINAAIELRAELGDVLWRSTRFPEAREALREALLLVGPERTLRAARLYTRLGRVEMESGLQRETDHRHLAAVGAFDSAAELLGEYRDDRSEEWVDTWLELVIDGRANLHNWRFEPDQAAQELARARPVAESRGSASRKAGLFVQLATERILRSGGGVDDDTVALLRRALEAAEQGAQEHEVATAFTCLGEALVKNGDLVEADEMLTRGMALLERLADAQSRSWCLCVRCFLEIRRHDVEAVRSLSFRARGAATIAEMPLWLGAATATEAWVAWKDDCYEDVLRLAHEALDILGAIEFAAVGWPTNYRPVCLWPLVSIHLASGHIDDAVEAGSQLLDPSSAETP